MNNILLVEEANYSVAGCVNGDSVELNIGNMATFNLDGTSPLNKRRSFASSKKLRRDFS